MNDRVLLRLVVTVALVVPTSAFAQAAAESALIHSLSSSTTVSAGSALSRTLNQGTTQLGIRIQQKTASPLQAGTQTQTPRMQLIKPGTGKLAARPVHRASSQSMGSISIQGGETCPATAATFPGPTAKTTTSADCHRSTAAPKSAADADMYKSFVMLPAPK
jgi:hypothetical protein